MPEPSVHRAIVVYGPAPATPDFDAGATTLLVHIAPGEEATAMRPLSLPMRLANATGGDVFENGAVVINTQTYTRGALLRKPRMVSGSSPQVGPSRR